MDIHGCLSAELSELQEPFSVFRIVEFRRLLRAEHMARIEETTNIYIYIIFMAEIACKISTYVSQKWFGGNIKKDVREM
jgi:hypothetical protein